MRTLLNLRTSEGKKCQTDFETVFPKVSTFFLLILNVNSGLIAAKPARITNVRYVEISKIFSYS